MIAVFCLDDQTDMLFFAKTARDAMEKALYTLNMTHNDPTSNIIETGKCLTFDHCGKTYSTLKSGLYQGRI